ncbi:MAG: PAS domain S-box protein [Anaerolineaceae bacterium]|nr:PAS domain S-box protein [Anaerolineaceae bacterium]
MSDPKKRRFRVHKRRYNQYKNVSLNNTSLNSNENDPLDAGIVWHEGFYRQMFERNHAVKLVVDASTTQIVKVNQAACDFYGYTSEQLTAMRVTDITVVPEAELLANMQRTMVEKGSIFQARHRLSSGEIRDVEIFSGLLEFGHKNYLYAIVQDITDRKQAERALRESEALYKLFAQNMPNTSVVMYDADLRITLAEGPYLKRFGTIWENAVGKLPHEMYGEEALKVVLPVYKRALEGETFTFERVTKEFAYQSFVTPLRNDKKEIIGGMILSHDITEAKRAEAALRASEARFHSLVDLAPVGIIQTDAQGKRVFCNSRWCEMTGITLEQALSDENYDTIYPEDLSIAAGAWDNMMATSLPFDNAIFRYQRPDKSTVWVSGNGRPLFDANGVITGYLGTVTDISSHKMLEDTLVISELRLRTLIDFAPVGIVETDEQGTIMRVNAQWCALSGISEVEAFTGNASKTIHPDDFERIQAINQTSLENGSPVNNIEYRFMHPDGKVVWVSDSSRPMYDELGNVTGHIITMTNITELKHLEEALRQNEERLRNITDNLYDLVTQNDAEGRIVFVSPSSRTMLGIEPQDVVGKLTFDFVHHDDWSKMISTRQSAVDANELHVSGEGRLRHADGHYIYVETEGTMLFDAQSHYAGSVLITRDMSERRRLYEALRQNEERLRIITDNIQDLVSQSSGDGLLTFVSPSYHTILGYNVQALIGTSSMDIVHPEDLANVVQAFQDAFEVDNYHFNVECRLRHMDGHYIDADIAGKLFFDDQSKFMGGVFIARDISERNRMQNLLLEKEKLQAALDKEHELSALKTRMMERIAHEFRTPLTVIQAATETLIYYYDRLNSEQRNSKGITIKGQIQRLTDMLQEIGLVVNGNFTPDRVHRQATNVSALCREVAAELERQLDLPDKYIFNLPESSIDSLDPHVTKNAIRHILRNAARFSPPYSKVNIDLVHSEKGTRMRVIDSGIGIPAQEIARLFEPFFRGSNIGEISGLGIGLTIAKAAIEAQDGTIAIESELKKGTTVTIWFPK